MSARHLLLLSFFLSLRPSSTVAQLPDTLSSSATISLLTTGPSSKELYAAFGHSSIRIKDSTQHLDILFNYGVFDFSQPNFYLNYIKGYLIYSLGLFDVDRYISQTKKEGRSLLIQQLSLDSSTQQSLYEHLLTNYSPEKRKFRYDYIYENCATKIRDLLETEVVGLRFGTNYLKSTQSPSTARELMNEKMLSFPWEKFGINLLLGVELDRPLQARAYMFLPEYVEQAVRSAEINNSTKLVAKEQLLLPNKQSSSSFPWPGLLLGGLLVSVFFISYRDARQGRSTYWVDTILLAVCGSLGLLMLLLWVATDHHSTWNYNLLWAWPTHLLLLVVLCKKKWRTSFFLPYMKIYGLLLVALLLGSQLLPQQLPSTLSLLWLSILLRVVHHIYLRKSSRKLACEKA